MFDPQAPGVPRIFAATPGEDFCAALIAGLYQRLEDHPPEAIARVTIYLSTQRMRRRIESLFRQNGPTFLPQLRLVAQAQPPLAEFASDAEPLSPLACQLQLTQLVRALIAAQPDLAPPSAAFDLAQGLFELLNQAHIEGVPFENILDLDVSDLSGHWARSLAFLRIAHDVGLSQSGQSTSGAALRAAVSAMARQWADMPPQNPVLVAGSLGSRGATRDLMQAVAHLPQGAIILPGFDWDMPTSLWSGLTQEPPQFDHPQYLGAKLLQTLNMSPKDVLPWTDRTQAPSSSRNRVLSMALRPAPVTDGWLRDGPGLGDLRPAMDHVTLLQADDPRHEASAIALCLREAAEGETTAALITPDRGLARRVTAALDRWGILPDDSAGEPLTQTAVGRLIRHMAEIKGTRLSADVLIAILKNPKVAEGGGRGLHLDMTRDLELTLRADGPAFPTAEDFHAWAAAHGNPKAKDWVTWLIAVFAGLDQTEEAPLPEHLDQLRNRVDLLAAGPNETHDSGTLWTGRDRDKAAQQWALLAEAAPHGGTCSNADFATILRSVLHTEVRDPNLPHPRIMIWGTLEARVQGAELVILGGLNEGSWPEQPKADPWLNRAMRKSAGLPVPDERIGLSAHDFLQAAAAPRVILSRAKRGADSDAVPSRWLNRLTNLLAGLPDQFGPEALGAMESRGQVWCDRARALDMPDDAAMVPPAPRPAPIPPVEARPRRMSVTDVEKLIRDPYQIYAKHVLRLKALPPLHWRADPALRGSVLHSVLEHAVPSLGELPEDDWGQQILRTGAEVLAKAVPWPTAQRMWLARLSRGLAHFVAEETARRQRGGLLATERSGEITLPGSGITLRVKTDRIDEGRDGQLWIYDYKSGTPPTLKQQCWFSKQLHITAYMAELGAFVDLPARDVAGAEYIGLGASPKTVPADFDAIPLASVGDGLAMLFAQMLDQDWGFGAQVARETTGEYSDYDHLSRAGEWDLTTEPSPMRVGIE